MLDGLNLRNFRAFKSQELSFSKINVFVGPNNSGKSSILSAINMISQTINSSDMDQNPIVLNGPFDNLGTFVDLVHGGRSNTPLGIDIRFSEYCIKAEFKYRLQRREIELVRYELLENGKSVLAYLAGKDRFDVKLFGRDIERIIPSYRKRRPKFRGLMPAFSFLSAIRLERHSTSQVPEEVQQKITRAERSIRRSRAALYELFEQFDSLSPFRDRPQRTYLYSGETAQHIGTTGSNTATILSMDESRRGGRSRDISQEISRWFRITGIAERVYIKSISPRHFEMALMDLDGLEHNICDVGFGCSQVLPVLAAALNVFDVSESPSRSNPILIVQEPEIHLHPNAQAALASFFAGLVPERGQLFVETHSDNFVLRLARHVADGTLNHKDVKIFYVHKTDGVSEINEIEIAQDGTFSNDWPGGFFPQRQTESLSLAQASYRSRLGTNESQLVFRYPEETPA